MKPTPLKRRARQLYLQSRNVAETLRLLKHEGFECHENTLRRWVDEEHWEKLAQEYDERAREADVVSATMEDEIMRRNIRMLQDLERKVIPGEQDAANVGLIRNMIDLQGQLLNIAKMREDRDKRAAIAAGKILPEQAGQIAKRLLDVLKEHPRVAALFREIGPELYATMDRRLEEVAG